MFFILSKIVDFLFSPVNWCVFLFLVSFLTKKESLSKQLRLSSFGVLVFFSLPFIFQLALNLFSLVQVPKANKLKVYEAGIIMGGMLSFNDNNDHLVFNSNCNRLTSAVELYKKGIIKRIVISGGSGSLSYPNKREASLLKKFMIDYFAISDSVIFIENLSNNTYQNALYTKQLLKKINIENDDLILITSSLHQARSYLCFKKFGMRVFWFDFNLKKDQKKWFPSQSIIPNEETLFNWVPFLHELVGLLVYKTVGYV
jgi:uncharacterized SAM-binding protein YcdF (DUF218 family)